MAIQLSGIYEVGEMNVKTDTKSDPTHILSLPLYPACGMGSYKIN